MFTGLIEEVGTVKLIKKNEVSAKLMIEGKKIFEQLELGDSVAVNGVCLTVCNFSALTFEADVMSETLARSNLGELKIGSKVNLERAMAANGRFGGHIVSGHIDGRGSIVKKRQEGIATWVEISGAPEVMRYIVEKGSVAVDGISLTVASVSKSSFQVSLIPHTGRETILLDKNAGQTVNLENDILGKYAEKLLNLEGTKESGLKEEKSCITKGFLQEHGF